MYQRLKREEYLPAVSESILFGCSGNDPSIPGHGIQSFTWTADAVRRLYEEILTDNDRSRLAEWKRFEHYKRVVGDPPPMCSTIVRTNRWTGESYYGTNSHIHCGTSRSPYAGYKTILSGGIVKPFGEEGALNQGLPPYYAEQSDGGFVPLPTGYDTMVSTSLKTMLPAIKAELSAVNSIIELKDFAGPVGVIAKALARIRQNPILAFKGLVNDLKSKRIYASKKEANQLSLSEVRDAFRKSSSGFLQWKFNISPLISDIRGVYAALSKVDRIMNDLVGRLGKVQRRHYAFRWDETVNGDEEIVGDMHWLGGYTSSWLPYRPIYRLSRTVVNYPSEFHAEIEYNINFTQYQVEHARLLVLLDSLGINLNPAIIWNAIPWSFVVDWVLGVSRWLDQFKRLNMEPKINIRKFLTSVKRRRDIFVWVTPHDDLRPDLPAGWRRRLPVVTETSYKRTNQLPGYSSITSSGVNADEFTLGAALVLAQGRRPKRKRQ